MQEEATQDFGKDSFFNLVSGENHELTQEIDNYIHPTAIIGPAVVLGKNNYIGPYCVITGDTKIGDNNRFEGHCSIGTAPEHKEFWNKKYKGVVIGNNCVIREFTTINSGTIRNTIVEDEVIMLRGSHIGHDSFIGHNCTISCNVLIGGESYLFPYVNCGLGSIVHQRSVLGACSLIGMGGIVTKKSKILPGQKYAGNPVHHIGTNDVGMSRSGIQFRDIYFKLENEFNIKWNNNNHA